MIITTDLLNTIVKIMAEGGSDVEVAAYLKLSKRTFRGYMNDPRHAELKEAYELGLTMYEAFFEKVGKDLMLGKMDKNAKDTVWKQFMMRKFGWKDQTEVTERTSSKELADDDLDSRIKLLQAKTNESNL